MAETINIRTDRSRALIEGCHWLSAGEPVAMPTETVYGLAADATNPAALARIYEVKGRPRFNPLIAHMADLAMAMRYADFDPISLKLAERFWPGPLTLVVPVRAENGIHPLCTSGLDTVGIRVPDGFASELIRAFGHPLAAPSANISGRVSPTSAEHVVTDLGARIALVLDGGTCGVGVESTILKVENGVIRVLRPGGLSISVIEAFAGQKIVREPGAAKKAIEAPGMLASHYAPAAKVRLEAQAVKPDEVMVNFGSQPIKGVADALAVYDLSVTGNLAEAAANLFAMMKKADQHRGSAIAFAPIPHHDLGEAINDRLRRAAAPRHEDESYE
jgi:L-threonylcarbamoyladenylate synthase